MPKQAKHQASSEGMEAASPEIPESGLATIVLIKEDKQETSIDNKTCCNAGCTGQNCSLSCTLKYTGAAVAAFPTAINAALSILKISTVEDMAKMLIPTLVTLLESSPQTIGLAAFFFAAAEIVNAYFNVDVVPRAYKTFKESFKDCHTQSDCVAHFAKEFPFLVWGMAAAFPMAVISYKSFAPLGWGGKLIGAFAGTATGIVYTSTRYFGATTLPNQLTDLYNSYFDDTTIIQNEAADILQHVREEYIKEFMASLDTKLKNNMSYEEAFLTLFEELAERAERLRSENKTLLNDVTKLERMGKALILIDVSTALAITILGVIPTFSEKGLQGVEEITGKLSPLQQQILAPLFGILTAPFFISSAINCRRTIIDMLKNLYNHPDPKYIIRAVILAIGLVPATFGLRNIAHGAIVHKSSLIKRCPLVSDTYTPAIAQTSAGVVNGTFLSRNINDAIPKDSFEKMQDLAKKRPYSLTKEDKKVVKEKTKAKKAKIDLESSQKEEDIKQPLIIKEDDEVTTRCEEKIQKVASLGHNISRILNTHGQWKSRARHIDESESRLSEMLPESKKRRR